MRNKIVENVKGVTLIALVVTVIGGNDECGMT